MVLRKRVFDLVWVVAAALGFCSAWLYGHPGHLNPLFVPAMLIAATLMAASLSLFAKREPSSEYSTELAAETCPVKNARYIAVNVAYAELANSHYVPGHLSYSREAGVRRVIQQQVKGSWNLARIDPYSAEHVHLAETNWSDVVLWSDDNLCTGEVRSGSQNKGRLNLLNDAVHIAKQLKGSGLQISITNDNAITLSEPSSRPNIQSESHSNKSTDSAYSWVN